MMDRWQLVVRTWLSGGYRTPLAPAARGGALPCTAGPFEHADSRAPMNPHPEPQAGGKQNFRNGALARALLHPGSAARHFANLRPARMRGAGIEPPAPGVQDLAGIALRDASREVRRLSTLLISVQEVERRRIAFDLHDGIGQSLSLLKMSVEKSLRLAMQGATQEAQQVLRELTPRIDEALAEVRRVSMELCPPMLEDLGLLPTLSWFLREFESTGTDMVLVRTISVAEHEVPRPLHIPIFRILQEALHNVAEHAEADCVHVRLERVGESLRLAIEDNGRGFDHQAVACSERHGTGLGLLSMRERASVSGASYRLHSVPGRGTTVSVAWH
jgi:signal transduction histidine kinase